MSDENNLDMILDIPVGLSAEVGSTHLSVRDVLAWRPEAVVELDNFPDEPLTVCINGIEMATAEAVEVDDRYGVRILSVVSAEERIRTLG